MNALIAYIVATIVSTGVFYAAYVILLRKEPLFRFNRFYLLSALFLSCLVPLIIWLPDSFIRMHTSADGNGMMRSILLAPVIIDATSVKIQSLLPILGYLYLVGVLLFSIRLMARLMRIYQLRQQAVRSANGPVPIRWSQTNIPPFSFFRTMYLPANLKDEKHLDEVIRHELVHIHSLHSFDIVFTQLMQIVCWMNPFIPLIEKSLREIHEFEADKAVITAGTDPVTYTKILFSQDKTALAVVLGNNFNYSLLKRRLTMFYRKNTRYARLKAVAVLPLAICIVMIYAIGCKQSANKAPETVVAPDAPAQTAPAAEPSGIVPPPPPPPPPVEAKEAGQVYTVVENMPQFPGGDAARTQFMINNIKYPPAAKEKGLQGTVYVSFVVEKDGSISNTKVLKGIGTPCDEEAIRVIQKMPKWVPGTQKGKNVRVQFTMPISFKLN